MRLMNRIIPDFSAQKEYPPRPAILGNEKGVALVMALVLGLVGMLMITAILYLVGTGTWTSGSKKRYQTALEASHGGMTFFAKEIIQNGIAGTSLSAMGAMYNGMLTYVTNDADFKTKLTTTGYPGYPGYPVAVGDNVVTKPDATMTLLFTAPTPNINVNAVILSTSQGNSGTSQNVLVGGGVVSNNSGTVTPQHMPYLFQTDIQAQSALSSREKARLSAIYAY